MALTERLILSTNVNLVKAAQDIMSPDIEMTACVNIGWAFLGSIDNQLMLGRDIVDL